MARFLLWLLMPLYMWGVTITEDTTLSEDTVYNEDVIVEGVSLNLNGFTMTVNGDLNISGANARLQMTMSQDKLVVTDDLTFSGASTAKYLTNGVIELAGNFYQKGVGADARAKDGRWYNATDNAYSFYPTEKHKVILNGSSKQIVDFEASNYSRFNHLEIQNTSSDGVIFEQLSVVGEWKRNDNHVQIDDIRNLILTEDYTISNDVDVIGGALNLNGFTLTINGSLKFTNANSRLKMLKADDKLIVKRDLTFSGASTAKYLTNGVIELAGNFYQKGVGADARAKDGRWYNATDNAYSFYPTENHKIILNGDSLQRVSFEAPDYSRFANLEITNNNVIFDLEAGKKVSVVNNLYLDESLYNSTYKNHEFLTYAHYRDIHKTYITLHSGLNLVALPVKQTITESQINSIFSDQNISYVLKYDNDTKKWYGFGNNEISRKKMIDHNVAKLTTIKAGEGFFVKTKSEVELGFPRDDIGYSFYDTINTEALSSGWNLLGTNQTINLEELLTKRANIKIIRNYKDGKYEYLSEDSDIVDEFSHMDISKIEDTNVTNSGFWVYID